MRAKSVLAGGAALAGIFFAMIGPSAAAPLGAPRLSEAAHVSSEAAGLIIQTQGRRYAPRAGGQRYIAGGGYRGGYYRGGYYGGRRGLSTGAAVGLGVGAAALGILGAAAAANAAPAPGYYYAPAPVYGGYGYGGYGGCYIASQPVYDDWGNYIGRQRVRVCD